MKKRELFKKLNGEFDRMTPAMSDRVKKEPLGVTEEVRARQKVYAAGGSEISAPRRVAAIAGAVLVLAAFVALIVFMPFGGKKNYIANDSYVTMTAQTVSSAAPRRITPFAAAAAGTANVSFSIVADSDGKVVKVTADSREAEIALAGASAGKALAGGSVDEAVNALTASSAALGYFSAGEVRLSSISARGDKVSADLAAEVGAEAEKAAGGAAVVSVVADKEELQSALGLAGEFTVSELLEEAAKRPGYLEETAEELFASGNGALYNSYLFELLEEYVDMLEDRQEALTELKEIHDEIRNELGLSAFVTDILVGGLLNPELDVDEELKEEFNEALEECAESLFVPQTDEELKAYYYFYACWDFDLVEDILDEFEDTVVEISRVFEELKKAVADFVDGCFEIFAELKAEWNDFTAGVSESGFSDPEDYIDKMKEVFEREYEKLLKK